MAHSDSLPQDVIDTVAAQLSAAASKTLGAAVLQHQAIELTESFSLWSIAADAIINPNAELAHIATQTGRWHHQVKTNGKATAFARSVPLGADAKSWSLRETFESDIAAQIDLAIDWIDANAKGDPLVRLLVVPAFQVHAFWLVEGNDSSILVVDAPEIYQRLKRNGLMSASEFLDAIRGEQHVSGVSKGCSSC